MPTSLSIKPIGLMMLLSLSSCVPQMQNMEGDVGRLRGDLNTLRSIQAEQTTAIAQIRAELRDVIGRVDEIQHGQKNLEDLKGEVTSIVKRVPPPAIVPAEALELDEAMSARIDVDGGKIFESALGKIRIGDFNTALRLLDEAKALSAGEAWEGNVSFWRAVALDGQGDPRGALGAYHDFASLFPKHSWAPLGLLRQASAFVRLGDSASAKLTLQKLIKQYPKATEATTAKARLKDL